MCLRFQFCTHQRVCILYFLKKSQIRCTLLYIPLAYICTICGVCVHCHLKVHKIENFFDSDFGICVISLLVMSKY
jgi:hypothetical protein